MALRDALLNGLDGLCGYPRSAAFRVLERLAAAGALDEPSVFVHALGDGNDMDAKVWTSGVGGEVPDEVKEAFAHFYKDLARGYRLKRGLRETVDGRLSDLLEIEKKKGKKGEIEETVQDVACQSTTWTPRMRSATWKRALARSSAVDLRGIEEKKFVALLPRFQGILEAMAAPVLREIEKVGNPEAALRGLVGASRLSTLRTRVRTAEELVRWLRLRCGVSWPRGPTDAVNFLIERQSEESRVSFPRSLITALAWFEVRAEIPAIDQIAQAGIFRNIVDQQVMLAESKEDVKKAPRLPVCVVVSLETAVTQEENPKVLRIVAWMRLLKVYGVLRADDLQRIVPDDVLYSETGLTATLRRTKTSGAGKKVRALTLFIPDFASISGEPWLQIGYSLWKGVGDPRRDHFLPRPCEDLDSFVGAAATPGDMVALNAKVLTILKVPRVSDGKVVLKEKRLIDDVVVPAWTGHSERATMTSSLAALGVSKSDRDPLGRWAASGSDDYVRSYRALVRRLVGVFVMSARSGMAYRDLDEESAMDDLSIRLLQKGVGKEDVDEKVVAMRKTAAGILGDLAGVKAVVIDLPRAPKETEASTELAKEGEDDEDDTKGEKTLYYISHPRNKKNMTMLHRSDGCWRARGLRFLDYHVFEGEPHETDYRSVCADCWPKNRRKRNIDPEGPVSASTSSSGSSAS